MRDQKKDRNPAKGDGLIGNHIKYGNYKIDNIQGVHNHTGARKLAEIKQTLVSGNITFLKVCKALELQFLRGQNENK